jgi:hypothetical protein
MSDDIEALAQRILDLPPDKKIGFLLDFAERLGDERDRYRAALAMIAIPPVHIPEVTEGCEGCAAVARAALDGVDVAESVATTLEHLAAQEAVIKAARRWHKASDVAELQFAVDDLIVAVTALDAKERT